MLNDPLQWVSSVMLFTFMLLLQLDIQILVTCFRMSEWMKKHSGATTTRDYLFHHMYRKEGKACGMDLNYLFTLTFVYKYRRPTLLSHIYDMTLAECKESTSDIQTIIGFYLFAVQSWLNSSLLLPMQISFPLPIQIICSPDTNIISSSATNLISTEVL